VIRAGGAVIRAGGAVTRVRRAAAVALVALVAGCHDDAMRLPGDAAPPPAAAIRGDHSSSIAVSADGATVYVVNADADSVSVIDTASRALGTEILLAAAHPAIDAAGAFTPAVMPRALALAPDGKTLYVTGQRAGALFAIELATRQVRSVAVGSEPVGVAVSADGAAVFVACSQDASVVRVDAASLAVTAHVAVPPAPWGLGWSTGDGSLVVTQFFGAGLTAIDPATLAVRATWVVPGVPARGDRTLAHGEVRGIYDVVARPGGDELWTTHLLLGTDTAQPALDFQSTVFPAVSIVHAGGRYQTTLSIDADLAGVDGAFGDVVSGPHALAFTPDGAFALVVDANSEDVLAIDAGAGVEAALLRPLPGHLPEGIAISPDGTRAYIDQRNTSDVAVVRIDRGGIFDPGDPAGDPAGDPTGAPPIALAVDGAAIPRLAADPMPAQLRLGQHLFYSANSDEYPVTQNHWVACASCHLEGRSDAVTWRFVEGPRDTPSNAGGMLGTGFLFRTAARNQVQDYWHTINVEQGGAFDPAVHGALLDAIAAYVNFAIPLPVPPTTDPALVAQGRAIFERADVGCAGCHGGPRFTDSGQGNATLMLGGTVRLHDVGTCVTGGDWPDVASQDVAGDPRTACDFDTPSLSGIAASPPYLHDGSAPSLRDVLERTRGTMGDISSLSPADEDALVEYLRSL
jgi:YVTN family beta-propeller protein